MGGEQAVRLISHRKREGRSREHLAGSACPALLPRTITSLDDVSSDTGPGTSDSAFDQSPTSRLPSVSFCLEKMRRQTPTARRSRPRRHLPYRPAYSDPHHQDERSHGCSIPFGVVGVGRISRWRLMSAVGGWLNQRTLAKAGQRAHDILRRQDIRIYRRRFQSLWQSHGEQ